MMNNMMLINSPNSDIIQNIKEPKYHIFSNKISILASFSSLNASLLKNRIQRVVSRYKNDYKLFSYNLLVYELNKIEHDIRYSKINFLYNNSKAVLHSCILMIKKSNDSCEIKLLLDRMNLEFCADTCSKIKNEILVKNCLRNGIYLGSSINHLSYDIRELIIKYL
jgi:hypothetical protein